MYNELQIKSIVTGQPPITTHSKQPSTAALLPQLYIIILCLASTNLQSQPSDCHATLAQNTKINNHFFIKEDNTKTTESSTLPTAAGNTEGPQYTPIQDSNFYYDSHLSLGFMYWLRKGLDGSQALWSDIQNYAKTTPQYALASSFAMMPANIFDPSPIEVVQRQLTIDNALSIPGIRPFHNGGLQFNLLDIGVFLGMAEDVSPKITYTLALLADVEIAIYSVSAQRVATVFAGTQPPGKYTIWWNGKDNSGKRAPSGDYIAEIRIGQTRFVRKRIVIE